MLRLGLVVDVRSSRRRLGGGDGGEPLELAGDIATTGREIAQSLRELEELL